MFIAQVFKYKHEAWRYFIGGFLIFTASQLGSLPLLGAVLFKTLSEGGNMATLEDSSTLMTTLSSNTTLFLMLLSFVKTGSGRLSRPPLRAVPSLSW